jgi:NMD protein affecting ribosome stability and mRNA decay
MKTKDRSKMSPEIGHSSERLFEDRHMKEKEKAQAGTAICTLCGAVGMHKHWFVDKRLAEQFAADPTVRFVNCPGCRRIANKVYEGEVLLKSSLLESNRNMIYGTLYHAAAQGFMRNPLSRIASVEDNGADTIRILTTTCTLAERLGKAVNRAFKGDLKIKPWPDERFVSVRWERP